MKRLLPSVALLTLLAFPAASMAAENERTLTARGSAVEDAAPDTAIITVAVETMAQSAKGSANENARVSENMLKALRKSLEPVDRAETFSFSVFPVYDYDKNRHEILKGFRTVHQIRVTASKPSSVGGILDAAIEAGANRVADVRFDVKDTTEACGRLIRAASERAASQAKAASSAFGTALDGLKMIVPSCARESEGPRPYAAELMRASLAPVEPGMVRLRAEIEAVYFLGNVK
jgi:uncharacterized protein YggE